MPPEHPTAPTDAPWPDDPWPDDFRPPTLREHRIAAALFFGFALFFVILFVVMAGWWYRWVVLALAVISVLYASSHAAATVGRRSS